jgi:hypothetical protein
MGQRRILCVAKDVNDFLTSRFGDSRFAKIYVQGALNGLPRPFPGFLIATSDRWDFVYIRYSVLLHPSDCKLLIDTHTLGPIETKDVLRK